jgi:hypothetical protein
MFLKILVYHKQTCQTQSSLNNRHFYKIQSILNQCVPNPMLIFMFVCMVQGIMNGSSYFCRVHCEEN